MRSFFYFEMNATTTVTKFTLIKFDDNEVLITQNIKRTCAQLMDDITDVIATDKIGLMYH